MSTRLNQLAFATAAALAALAVPATAWAQDADRGDAPRGHGVNVTPYVEASQIVYAELEPGSDVVTYSQLAAGVDASITGRNSAAAVSLRYEREIGISDNAPDGDVISGIARASLGIVPRTLSLEAGALATRASVEGNGGTILSPLARGEGSSQIYSGYVGPSIHAQTGPVTVEGHYRLGYTKVEEADDVVTAPGADPVDVFDDSTVHAAQLRVGTKPREVLPVGLAATGGWYQEEISNLDQRVKDRYVRGDVAVPVGRTVQLVAGAGYEDVEVSSRDVLRDGGGAPVIGADGRYVTDKSGPRQIAYETSGLIWDAGVMWRPSRRTALEAHVGKRYDSTTYYGTFAWSPDSRSSFNVAVYDGIAGFGGQMTNVLADLPAEFQALRNPISGDITGCVQGAQGASNCFAGAFGSIRSSVFRSRGVMASYGIDWGRTSLSLGAGYDRRKFIGAEGTILEQANGVADENIWLAANLDRQIDVRSRLSFNAYANWFESGFDAAGGSMGFGASAAYYRNIVGGLTGTVAVSLDGITRDSIDDEDLLGASALVGLRYSFGSGGRN
jgi:hypothetical protein